jgi:glycosyltransferase involved in cell wall biosynthesis
VLFVAHDANRTGAPLFLLNFLRWLDRSNPEIAFDILLRRSGPLDAHFAAIASTTYHWQPDLRIVTFLAQRRIVGKRKEALSSGLRRLTGHSKRLLARLARNSYDLVFVNSLANADLIPALAEHIAAPMICRAPELARYVDAHIGTATARAAVGHVDTFIAVSDLVAQYLVDQFGVAQEQIERIPGFARLDPIGTPRAAIRRQLGLADTAFVVCGSGTTDWRKGPDLFVQIAAHTRRRFADRDIRFCWIGGDHSSDAFRKLQFDLQHIGIDAAVTFIAETDAPQDYYAASDLLALTSREDPFPLVALEAAALGLPVICFDAAVGSKEFLGGGNGLTVPYLDVCAFADSIAAFRDDVERYQATAHAMRTLAKEFTVDTIGERLVAAMRRVA